MDVNEFIFSKDEFDPLSEIPNLTEQVRLRVVSPDQDYVQTRSGLFVPPSTVPKSKPTHFDAFCGAGGFGLGVTEAGFRTVGAFDFDISCALTYIYNLCSYPCRIIVEDKAKEKELEKAIEKWIMVKGKKGKVEWNGIHSGRGYVSGHPEIEGCPVFILGDVRKMSGEFLLNAIGMKKGEIDLMTGGPPCQGFSVASRRDIADPRNNLVYEFGRLICEMQPKTIVMENVPGILNMTDQDGIGVIDRFCYMLENGGWSVGNSVKKMLTGDPKARMIIRTKTVTKKDKNNSNKHIKSKATDSDILQLTF